MGYTRAVRVRQLDAHASGWREKRHINAAAPRDLASNGRPESRAIHARAILDRMLHDIRDLHAFLIDMDGVLYRGEAPIAGMQEFLAYLDARTIPHLFLTNNSSMTPRQYADKLHRMGVTTSPERILNSAIVTAAHVRRSAGARVFMLGGMGVREALADAGLALTDSHEDATHVVVGLDREVSYEKLARATLAVRRGAEFLGTNGDLSYPSERGLEPGAGALLAAIEAASGVAPRLFGKPEAAMFETALHRVGTEPARTAMIGDRYETDILGGQRAGLVTIAVTTGVHDENHFRRQIPPPDFIYASVAEIHHAISAIHS